MLGKLFVGLFIETIARSHNGPISMMTISARNNQTFALAILKNFLKLVQFRFFILPFLGKVVTTSRPR